MTIDEDDSKQNLEPQLLAYEDLNEFQKKSARSLFYFAYTFYFGSLWYALFFGLLPFLYAIFSGNYDLGVKSGSTMIQASILSLAARIGLFLHKEQAIWFSLYVERMREKRKLYVSILAFVFIGLSIIAVYTGYYSM